MTVDNRNEDPDRALAAFIKPLEPPTLSSRLRAAADDIAFQGRLDPHNDKALLRDAADHIESLEVDAVGSASALRAAARRADIAGRPLWFLAEIEKAWQCRHADLGICGHYDGPEEGAVFEMFKRMMAHEDALEARMKLLGDCLNAMMMDRSLDLELFPIKPDGSRQLEGEGGVEMAVRLLKLAARRGAYATGKHIETEQGPMLLVAGRGTFGLLEVTGDGPRKVAEDARTMAGNLLTAREANCEVMQAALASGATLLERIAAGLEPVRRDSSPPSNPAAPACTGSVAPGEAAVETRFVDLFYLSGPRVGLRFDGMPDIYVPDADAHTLAKAVLLGGEAEAPSWKVISRAAEYFGQRVHVDSARGKLVLTDSGVYHPGEDDKASETREAAADARIMSGNLIAARGYGPQVMQAALASAATLLDRLAGILEPVREDRTREMCADDFGPEAAAKAETP